MSAYVDLTALKEAVGITGAQNDTVDDGILRSVIFRASAAVDAFLEQNRVGYIGFAASSNSRTSVGSNTRVYDGTGSSTLFIDDATTVAAVSVDTVTVSSNSWRLWPYNDTPKRAIEYAAPVSSLRGLTNDLWSRGTANVAVTAYWGLDHVPSDVEQATIAVAIVYWRRYQQGEPEPSVRPAGVRGYSAADPEVEGILVTALSGWVNQGVYGG